MRRSAKFTTVVLTAVVVLVAGPGVVGDAVAATGATDTAIPIWRNGQTGFIHEFTCSTISLACTINIKTVAPPGSCTSEIVTLPNVTPAFLYRPTDCDASITGTFTPVVVATNPQVCALVGGLATVTFTTGTQFPIFSDSFSANATFVPLTFSPDGSLVVTAQLTFLATGSALASHPGGVGNIAGDSFQVGPNMNLCTLANRSVGVTTLTPGTITMLP